MQGLLEAAAEVLVAEDRPTRSAIASTVRSVSSSRARAAPTRRRSSHRPGLVPNCSANHPAGTFLRAPAGSWHVPQSATGCRLFVFYPEG